MGMMSAYDIAWIENTVREVINEWRNRIKIYSRLPKEEQPNYNHLMHEFTGDSYCSVVDIIAERKDIVNNMTNDPDPDNLDYGRKNNGVYLYAIPDVVEVNGERKRYEPSLFDLVTIGDDDVYYIRSVRSRIGETLITIKRFTGHKPEIVDTDGNTVIRGYDWSVEDG